MVSEVGNRQGRSGRRAEYWTKLRRDIKRDKWLYLMLLPGLIYFVIFKYLPMYGIIISFENYVPFSGVTGSEWVGLKWFSYFFKSPSWIRYLTNTLILSLMNIVLYFPAPIILALLLNEMRSLRYKKVLQTLLYVPHFISIVIVVSITFVIFGSSGIVYKATEAMLGHPVKYLSDPRVFRWMIIGQTIWKETGWGTIIFLAALTNVDTQLYEAAEPLPAAVAHHPAGHPLHHRADAGAAHGLGAGYRLRPPDPDGQRHEPQRLPDAGRVRV